jgi:hypothetical protein
MVPRCGFAVNGVRIQVGAYVSIRGWMECAEEQIELALRLASSGDESWSNGWRTSRTLWGWSHYLFYGADIREQVFEDFLDQLRSMADLPRPEDSDDRIRGFFLVSHEVHGMTEYLVKDGRVIASAADPRLAYLDE